MPTLLYGSENWILTESMVKNLEAFQGELVKRILKWPKHLANLDFVFDNSRITDY